MLKSGYSLLPSMFLGWGASLVSGGGMSADLSGLDRSFLLPCLSCMVVSRRTSLVKYSWFSSVLGQLWPKSQSYGYPLSVFS